MSMLHQMFADHWNLERKGFGRLVTSGTLSTAILEHN